MSSDQLCFDQKMIEKAKGGSSQALEYLVERHQGLIRMLARRLCCESVLLDDLLQAGNVGLLYALGHYDSSMHTKLLTYAVPWILGEMRRTLKRIENSKYSLDEPLDRDGQTLHDVLSREECVHTRYIDLRIALESLSSEEQILICMRYYRDKTQREAALLMGKSQAQISKMENKALDTLRKRLS